MKKDNISPALWIVPAAMLLIALAPLPYGYYQLLRVVVFVAALVVCCSIYVDARQVTGWIIGFAFIALVFNPIIPIRLTRTIWSILNVLGAGAFLFNWHFFRRSLH